MIYNFVASKLFDGRKYYYYYIGTNEDIEYKSIDDLLSSYSFREITEDEYNTLSKLGISYGFDPIGDEIYWGCVCDECKTYSGDKTNCKGCPINEE